MILFSDGDDRKLTLSTKVVWKLLLKNLYKYFSISSLLPQTFNKCLWRPSKYEAQIIRAKVAFATKNMPELKTLSAENIVRAHVMFRSVGGCEWRQKLRKNIASGRFHYNGGRQIFWAKLSNNLHFSFLPRPAPHNSLLLNVAMFVSRSLIKKFNISPNLNSPVIFYLITLIQLLKLMTFYLVVTKYLVFDIFLN